MTPLTNSIEDILENFMLATLGMAAPKHFATKDYAQSIITKVKESLPEKRNAVFGAGNPEYYVECLGYDQAIKDMEEKLK
jgi:flavodoxin